MKSKRFGYPHLGFGVGLRTVHFQHILKDQPEVDWFEIISENFMDSQGRPRYVLAQVAERYPVVMHGVSLSIGSTDPLDFTYLKKLKGLAQEVKAQWISDHLCWTGVAAQNTHDLLPIPFNEKSLKHVVERVRIVQDFLERPLVLENPSSYVTFRDSTMEEWEFISALAEEADCGLLVDVNNVYVSSFNHDLDPVEFLSSLPHQRIVQFHLAGHSNYVTHLIDTHDHHVVDQVWSLYRLIHDLTGGVSTLLEWDALIPPFEVVHEEVLKAKRQLAPASKVAGRDGAQAAAGERGRIAEPSRPPDASRVPHPLHHVIPEVE